MYYLMKKAKYSKTSTYSFTTVDCNFGGIIHSIWRVYFDLDNTECNVNSKKIIVSYINGYRLLVIVSWSAVGNVFIPVCIRDKFYWVLLVVLFNDRSIMVYDSTRSPAYDAYIHKEVIKFEEFIPTYLTSSQFY